MTLGRSPRCVVVRAVDLAELGGRKRNSHTRRPRARNCSKPVGIVLTVYFLSVALIVHLQGLGLRLGGHQPAKAECSSVGRVRTA